MLIDFLKLGGSGACSPRKIFNFSISGTVSGGKFQGLGEVCHPLVPHPLNSPCIYTIASVNTSVKVYIPPLPPP